MARPSAACLEGTILTAKVPPFEPASLPRRLAAFCYDALLLAALLVSFTLAVLALRLGKPVPPGSLWFELCVGAIVAAYFCAFWVHGGQTVGMRAWRIRVLRRDGAPLGWAHAAARLCAAVASVLPLGLGLWWSLANETRCTWHDRLTHTRVVRTDAAGRPSAHAPTPQP